MTDSEACLILNLLPAVGPVTVQNLLRNGGSTAAILTGSTAASLRAAGVNTRARESILHWSDYADLDTERDRIRQAGITILALTDDAYPQQLKQIYDPPLCLYVRGSTDALQSSRTLAVVGSRRTTRYGADTTERLVRSGAAAGWTIVSGLARGIDTVAHQTALDCGGCTIAVMAGGLGHVYPQENIGLARRISENGAVISEQPVAIKPDRRSFPMRNRIIAGLTAGTLVVEAGTKSGSLITAQQALDQGRQVFAVPGRVDSPQSRGCHWLLKQGARLVERFEDIDEEFDLFSQPAAGSRDAKTSRQSLPLNEEEQIIVTVLKRGELSVDEIAGHVHLPVSKVLATMLGLEVKRVVCQRPGNIYSLPGKSH